MSEKRFSAEDVERYCCIDLMQAVSRDLLATATGGIWLAPDHQGGCLSHVPKLSFCPFCGAQINVWYTEGKGWDWNTLRRPT